MTSFYGRLCKVFCKRRCVLIKRIVDLNNRINSLKNTNVIDLDVTLSPTIYFRYITLMIFAIHRTLL